MFGEPDLGAAGVGQPQVGDGEVDPVGGVTCGVCVCIRVLLRPRCHTGRHAIAPMAPSGTVIGGDGPETGQRAEKASFRR